MPVSPIHLMENGNEHWWNIREKIFRLHAIKKRGVLSEFIRDLIDDEATAVRKRLICFREQRPLFFDFENAERDSGENIIAVRNAPARQLLQQTRSIPIDNMDTGVSCKLATQIPGKSGIQLEEEQLGTRRHPAHNFSRVNAFTRAVLGYHPRFAEIHLARHLLYQRLRAWCDRRDLKRTLQKPFEEESAHEGGNSRPPALPCPVRI